MATNVRSLNSCQKSDFEPSFTSHASEYNSQAQAHGYSPQNTIVSTVAVDLIRLIPLLPDLSYVQPVPQSFQHLKLHNRVSSPLAPHIPLALHERQYSSPTSHCNILTSVVYAKYPINAGNATTYAKVILAVRPVHLKYLCRLTNISAHH